MSMMNLGNIAVVGMLSFWLGGCVHVPTAAVATRVAGMHVKDTAPVATSIADLAAHAEDAAYEGRMVAVEASFERYHYTLGYGKSFDGYRLWDHAGHWVLCQNIYTARSVYPGVAPDASRDLTPGAAARLLGYGTFVKLTGAFHCQGSGASHGGIFTVPASLDVYTIDGAATHQLVNS